MDFVRKTSFTNSAELVMDLFFNGEGATVVSGATCCLFLRPIVIGFSPSELDGLPSDSVLAIADACVNGDCWTLRHLVIRPIGDGLRELSPDIESLELYIPKGTISSPLRGAFGCLLMVSRAGGGLI